MDNSQNQNQSTKPNGLSVAEGVLILLEKYNSGEFSKIDCDIVFHKRDDQILKLQNEINELKKQLAGLGKDYDKIYFDYTNLLNDGTR